MGLDQYAYARDPRIERDEEDEDDWGGDVHIMDWRKHNRLHGWMEDLWEDKGRPYEGNLDDLNSGGMGEFNCVPVELTLEDLDDLEDVVNRKVMPETGGFFFGDDSFSWENEDGKRYEEGDYFYKETDLQFVEDARGSHTFLC